MKITHWLTGIIIVGNSLSPTSAKEKSAKPVSSYFSPPPGEEIIASSKYTWQGKSARYGEIKVSPPHKGSCLTLTTNPDRPDVVVCKETAVRFFLEDLSESGELTWTVKIPEKKAIPAPLEQKLSWPSPHRPIKFLRLSQPIQTGMEVKFLERCISSPLASNTYGDRKIEIRLLDDPKPWIVHFPPKDQSIPSPTDEAPVPFPPNSVDADLGVHWTISTRARVYTMPGSAFYAEGFSTPGAKGSCRYQYDSIEGDFSSGRLECHHTSEFVYVYIPFLNCLNDIKVM